MTVSPPHTRLRKRPRFWASAETPPTKRSIRKSSHPSRSANDCSSRAPHSTRCSAKTPNRRGDMVDEANLPDALDVRKNGRLEAAPKKSWRNVIKLHPVVECFDAYSQEELTKLGEDIKANGLRVPVAIWHDGADEYAKKYLID